MNQQNFFLHIKNKTPLKQKIIAFSVGGILLIPLLYYWIISIDHESFWIPMIIFIVGLFLIIYVVIRLLADKKPLTEEAVLQKEKIISTVYGEINFKEIKYYITDYTTIGIHFLRIFLKDGEQLTWENSDYKKYTTEDFESLNKFCKAFIQNFQDFKETEKPNFPKQFKFTFFREKGYFYLLICFLFVPVLFIPEDINDFDLWIFPIIMIPIVGGLLLTFKHTIKKEEIEIFSNHLLSKQYGKIDFQDIKEIISTQDWKNPSLVLKLKNKKDIFWKMPSFGIRQTEKENKINHAEIWHFIAQFEKITSFNIENNKISSEKINSPKPAYSTTFQKKHTSKYAKNNVKQASHSTKLSSKQSSSQQTSSIPHKKVRKSIYIGLPVGFVVAFLILARNCAGEYKKKRSPFYNLEEKTTDFQQQTLSLLQDFTVKNGPYYVYTNQDSVRIFYKPSKKITSFFNQTDLLMEEAQQKYTPEILQESNQTHKFYKELTYAKKYPDSVDWQLILQQKEKSFPVYNTVDLTDAESSMIYLVYFIPKATIERTPAMKAYAKRNNLPEKEDMNGVLPLAINENLTVSEMLELEENKIQYFLHWYEKYPEKMQFYLITHPQTSAIHQEDFKNLSVEILDKLKSEGVEIKDFKFKELPN